MKYGICLQSLVPVRKQPGDQQEMSNQLLFGDIFFIKDQLKEWLLIETVDDQFDGWVDQKQAAELEKSEFDILNISDRFYAVDYCSKICAPDQKKNYQITLGSRLPRFANEKIIIKGIEYKFDGHYRHTNDPFSNQSLNILAKIYLGSHYLWGGRSPFGIDCSGLVQIVFKMCGFLLPRNSSEQVDHGEAVNFIDDARAGDLAFFDNEENKIIHVGIMLNNNQIIHASGEVRIDKIDHFGIYNEELKKYSHHLRIIKRIDGLA